MNLPFGSNPDAAALWLCRAVQTGAALVLAGTAAIRLLAWGSAPLGTVPRWNRLASVSWCALLLAAVIQLGATAAQMSDLPFAQVFHGDVLAGVLKGTHFGAVWQVRIALLGGLLVTGLMGGAAQRSASRRLTVIADVVTALLDRLACRQSGGGGSCAGVGEARLAAANGHDPRGGGRRVAGRVAPAGAPARPGTPQDGIARSCHHDHAAIFPPERRGGRRAGDERIIE